MSNKDNKVAEKVEKVEKVDDKAVEAIQTLRVQLEEHLKQERYHHTMSVKAQGALEVLLQLHPQEEEK